MSDAKLTLIMGGVEVAEFSHKPRPTGCYACFDMVRGNRYVCPACGEGHGTKRLPEGQRPSRPHW